MILGIGIDESTAILYQPDDRFEVFGEGSVIIYDPRGARVLDVPDSKKLSVEHMRLSVLRAGQVFDMKAGKILN